MKRKNMKIAFIAVLLVALSFGGFKYMQTMPQVKSDEAVESLDLYCSEVEGLYVELNEAFESNSESSSMEGWQDFSSEWMVKANNIKPEVLDKRMEEKYGNFATFITAINGEVIDLWNSYNKYIHAEDDNRAAFEPKIAIQKESIEAKIENLNEVLK